MPRSLLLITGIFPPDSGGPAKFTLEYGNWASHKGLDVTVHTYSDQSNHDAVSSHLRIRTVSRSHPLIWRYIRMIKGIGKSISPENSVLAVGAFLETYLSSIFYRFSYVVKVPGDIVWERARNNGVTQSDIENFQTESLSFMYRIFRELYTRSLKRANYVIVPSMGLFNLCSSWGIPVSKIRLIYNSVDSVEIPSIPDSGSRYDLVTVCRLTSWKGVDEIIKYAANSNKALCVVGDGPERHKLEVLAQTLRANVDFVGEVSHQNVYELILQSKVFVLNSYYEGLPHALVEARAAGKLSVGRAGTGSAEVIHDDVDGLLIRSDRSLKETLDLALGLELPAKKMTSLARLDSQERFSKVNNYPEILNLVMGT